MQQILKNNYLLTLYCPVTFEIFKMRTNNVITITELKHKIAKKFQTTIDNVIITCGDKEFKGENYS
jgi:hypothetical protein